MGRLGIVSAALLTAAGLTLFSTAAPAAGAPQRAQMLVSAALKQIGGVAPLVQAGGVTMEARGTFDLAARLQGRAPHKPEPTPISERLTVDLRGGRLAYRVDWFNYQHSNQRLMEIFDAQGRVLYVDQRNGSADWSPHAYVPDQGQRYRRLVPHLLLQDALDHAATLQTAGRVRLNGKAYDAATYATGGGDWLTLYFETRSGLLAGAAARLDMPVLGDTPVSWWWSGIKDGGQGLRFPAQLTVKLGDKTLKTVALSLRRGVSGGDFAAPEGLKFAEPPEPKPYKAPEPAGTAEPQVRDLGDGLYLTINLRPGFHVPFVEFADFAVVIDAPSIWYEMQHLPPMNWSMGDSSVALGEKLLKAVKKTLPGKPVKYLVLTHHHTDHIGGLRPFLDDGATIVTGPQTAEVARRAAAAPLSLAGYKGKPIRNPKIEIVKGTRTIGDGTRTLQLIALPSDNPQAEDFLVAYLPRNKTLYTTAFIYPVPEQVFPLAESVDASKWFVRWLDGSGLDVKSLLNVHGQGRVQPWQIEKLRKLIATGADSD